MDNKILKNYNINNNKIFDTIIIGGGISGLNTAYQLKKNNNNFLLLEGRERLGGRTETIKLTNETYNGWVDFGGQWLGTTNINLKKIINELGLKTFKQFYNGKTVYENENSNFNLLDEESFQIKDFKIENLNYFILKIDSLINKIDFKNNIDSLEIKNNFDSISLNEWLLNDENKANNNNKILTFFNWVSKMSLATDSNKVSFLFFLKYIKSVGSFEGMFVSNETSSESDRIIGGSQSISNKLGLLIGKENIRLKNKVVAINQTNKIIIVTTDLNYNYYCKNVVVTIPPILLKDVSFIPKLPEQKENYLNNIQNGSVIKIVAVYSTQFWRNQGHNGKIISFIGPITESFDNSTDDNQLKSIVGFIVGKESVDHWTNNYLFEQRKLAVLSQYAKYWGKDALSPLYYNEKNWNQDSFSGGCFSAICKPNQSNLSSFNNSKKFGNIYWAGTETSNEWYGHMEGAIISSNRVIDELLKSNNKSNL